MYQGDLKFKEVNPNTNREEEVHKIYIGSTATTFQARYGGHKFSFDHVEKETATTLSAEIWRLKKINPNYEYDLKFSIVFHLLIQQFGSIHTFAISILTLVHTFISD